MRILFADDDRELCRASRTLLEHEGYTVETVYNGEDALEMAETGEFDGMILDWMMPEKDGVETLREMRSKGITTPCLLLTASSANCLQGDTSLHPRRWVRKLLRQISMQALLPHDR